MPWLPFALTPSQALHFTGCCWAIFLIFWLLAAANVKRTTERWSSATWFGYLLANASAVIFNLLFKTAMLGRTAADSPQWAGAFRAGRPRRHPGRLAITLWARVVLGRNWSGSITHKEDHELIERGPYGLVRHPIYTGMLLMVTGTAIARGTADAFAAIALFTAVHLWKLHQEEALMTRYFPNAYPAYRSRTKALFPLLY